MASQNGLRAVINISIKPFHGHDEIISSCSSFKTDSTSWGRFKILHESLEFLTLKK